MQSGGNHIKGVKSAFGFEPSGPLAWEVRVGFLGQPVEVFPQAADHCLIGQVASGNDAVVFFRQRLDIVKVQREGQHFTRAVSTHAVAAFLHQAQSGFKIQRPGGNQGAIFAEAVATGQDRFYLAIGQLTEDFQAGQRMSKQGGLSVAGQPQVFLRPFQA